MFHAASRIDASLWNYLNASLQLKETRDWTDFLTNFAGHVALSIGSLPVATAAVFLTSIHKTAHYSVDYFLGLESTPAVTDLYQPENLISAIHDLNSAIGCYIEECLTPPLYGIDFFSWVSTLISQAILVLFALPLAVTSLTLRATLKVSDVTWTYFNPPVASIPSSFKDIVKDTLKWQTLNQHDLEISLKEHPPGEGNASFLYGPATCTYQDSGNMPHSQWDDHEKACISDPANRASNGPNLFHLYQTNPIEVIKRLQALNANSYRFSIEWSHIEPNEGEINESNLNVYVEFCKQLRQSGIEPVITLHHFSEPKWFHASGSFSNPFNQPKFIHFVDVVVRKLTEPYLEKPLVTCFFTINEPNVEAFSREVRGSFSPSHVMNFQGAALFLIGALKAHNAAYTKIKEICPAATVGFTHQYLRFLAGNPLLDPIARYMTRLLNDATLSAFSRGVFELKIPFLCHLSEPLTIQTDCVGVQYYTRPIIGMTGSVTAGPAEAMTQMPFREDPAGLYEALTTVYTASQKPVIVTENGISTDDETQRYRYMLRALYAFQQAILALPPGAIFGYMPWSFCRNGEWDMGIEPQDFGLYGLEKSADGSKRLAETYKRGVQPFVTVATAWKKSLSAARASA